MTGRLPPPREPLEYRNTQIDVFVGGPADGEVLHTNGDRDRMYVAMPPPGGLNLFRRDDAALNPDHVIFTKHGYRIERMRTNRGDTITDVSFWISEDLTIEQALVKLCLGYHPEPSKKERAHR